MTKESPLKHYLSIPSVFADLINGVLHDGKQKIKSTDLTLVDPSVFYCPEIKLEPFYDHLCLMTTSKATYALYSVEDQSQIDAALVAKIAMYNATRYFNEMVTSQFCKPIISLVVNFDATPWGLPTSLYEMMGEDNSDEWMLRYVPNYKIALYDPHTKDDFSVFQTELKEIFECVKGCHGNTQMELDFRNQKNPMFQVLQDKCLLDDLLMKLVFSKNIPLVQLVLQIILAQKDLTVTKAEYYDDDQIIGKRLWYFAIEAVDRNGQTYDIEMRNFDAKTGVAGVFYHFSFANDRFFDFDRNDADKPTARYVIFISGTDVMGEGRPIYAYILKEKTTYKPLGDGSHIVYVNGAYEDNESDIGKLMHDFRCKEPSEMYFDVFAKAVGHFKNDEKSV